MATMNQLVRKPRAKSKGPEKTVGHKRVAPETRGMPDCPDDDSQKAQFGFA